MKPSGQLIRTVTWPTLKDSAYFHTCLCMFIESNWFLTTNSPIDLIKDRWSRGEEEYKKCQLPTLSICNPFLHRTFGFVLEEDKIVSFQNHTDMETVSSCEKIPMEVLYEPKNICTVRGPGSGVDRSSWVTKGHCRMTYQKVEIRGTWDKDYSLHWTSISLRISLHAQMLHESFYSLHEDFRLVT